MPAEMQDFQLGIPALVCRWRLAGATLPLANRHLRALSQRTINDKPLSQELLAWVKQQLEWALKDGAAAHPDGCLMLVVDEESHAAMSVGPYEELPSTKFSTLMGRARQAEREAAQTLVAPESIIAWKDEQLFWHGNDDTRPSGALSLVLDLARQMGIVCIAEPKLLSQLDQDRKSFDGIALVSDEHGVVCAQENTCNQLTRFQESYHILLEKSKQ